MGRMGRRKRMLDAADLIPREDIKAAIGATLRAERQMMPTTKATLGEMLARKRFGEDSDPTERAVAIRDAQTSTELLTAGR